MSTQTCGLWIKATMGRLVPTFSSLHQLLIWKSPRSAWWRSSAPWATSDTCRHVSPGWNGNSCSNNLLLKGRTGADPLDLFAVAVTSHTCPEHTLRHTLCCCCVRSCLLRCPIFFFFFFFFSFLIRARAFKIWPRQMGERSLTHFDGFRTD